MNSELKEIQRFIEQWVREGTTMRSTLLMDGLGLQGREVISLVGAGGKTTLLFRLANELIRLGKTVITTTTTKILEPLSNETPRLVVNSDEREIQRQVALLLGRDRHVTVALERLGSGKLRGVSPDFVATLWNSVCPEYLIVEADGAAGRSVKAPREHEPVIPGNTTLVIALVGADAIDQELSDKVAFQPGRISDITGLPLGERMTSDCLATLITHREGMMKGVPEGARVVCVINKADSPERVAKGRELAHKVLEKRPCQIERVVVGQLKSEPPVLEMFLVPPSASLHRQEG